MSPSGRALVPPVVLLGVVLLAAARPAPARADDNLIWWTAHALVKVRPGDRPDPSAARRGAGAPVTLSAARNEFEPFQVVLRARERPVRRVDAELTDLVAESGEARIASREATVYLERFVELRQPSSAAGGTGEWPDPLVPRVDPYADERRNAFPFDLAERRSQPLWVELYVPTGTAPGRYSGALRVTVAGSPRFSVPVTLHVQPFTLPSTSSLRTAFGFSGPRTLAQHRGRYTSDDDLYRLTRLYAEAALRHRVSLYGGAMVPPPERFTGDRARIDWSTYDRENGPFLDGTVFGADDPLPGARATAVDVTTKPGLDDRRKVLTWRAWAAHFREKGWLDRLFLYLWDEPRGPTDYPKVLHVGRLAREADPELPTLLTEQLVPELAGVVDVWAPLVNCLEPRPGVPNDCEATVAPAAYAKVRSGGSRLWVYTSCASHGCDRVGGPESAAWPSYAIDAPAVAARILPWIAFSLGLEGELYYDTVEAYGAGEDPWHDVRRHGGNGDGTLFYPGTPAEVGGRTDVPVPSLRLALIREGLEDYEYLVLAERAGAGALARSEARTVAPGTFDWSHDPEAVYAARAALAREIVRRREGGGS